MLMSLNRATIMTPKTTTTTARTANDHSCKIWFDVFPTTLLVRCVGSSYFCEIFQTLTCTHIIHTHTHIGHTLYTCLMETDTQKKMLVCHSIYNTNKSNTLIRVEYLSRAKTDLLT